MWLVARRRRNKRIRRAAERQHREGDVQIPRLIDKFKCIATAQVATSADEAFNLGYFMHQKDSIVRNAARNISEAKKKCLSWPMIT